jgi:hypothetical protein
MADVEHEPITVKVCPVDGKPVNQWLSCDEHHRWAVDAEFVPADQLRGAVDPMRETRIARARGLAQAIAECRDDARLDGIREGAAEIVTLLGGQ